MVINYDFLQANNKDVPSISHSYAISPPPLDGRCRPRHPSPCLRIASPSHAVLRSISVANHGDSWTPNKTGPCFPDLFNSSLLLLDSHGDVHTASVLVEGLFCSLLFSRHLMLFLRFFVLQAQSARVALGPCIEHLPIVTEFSSSDSSVVSDDDCAAFMISKIRQ
eukprot:s603_g7.t1